MNKKSLSNIRVYVPPPPPINLADWVFEEHPPANYVPGDCSSERNRGGYLILRYKDGRSFRVGIASWAGYHPPSHNIYLVGEVLREGDIASF